jgi:hypothetical protein
MLADICFCCAIYHNNDERYHSPQYSSCQLLIPLSYAIFTKDLWRISMTQDRCALLHQAAKLVREKGTEAGRTLVELVGPDIAVALLIAHVRQDLAQQESHLVDADLDERVNEIVFGAIGVTHVRRDRTASDARSVPLVLADEMPESVSDAPVCDVCRGKTQRNGAGFQCISCGNTMGCS